MNSIRYRLAILMVLAVLVVNFAAIALFLLLVGPRIGAATLTPIAQNLIAVSELAGTNPAAVAQLGGRIAATPETGAESRGVTRHLATALAELRGPEGLRVVYKPDRAPPTAILPLADGQWLAIEIPDFSPEGTGYYARFLWLGVMAVGIGMVAFYAAWRVTVPLKLLHDTMLTIGADGVPEPFEESGPIELRATAAAINRLSDRLRKSIASRMRLVAAAGHDLRTPMTRMRLRAEFIADDADREKWLADLAEMEAIADSAIRLVREEVGAEVHTELRLDLLLQEIAAELREIGHRVALADPPRISVRGGPVAIKRALRNLVINAATHGGGAEVRMIRIGPTVEIHIADHGPGIPEDLLEQVFEPFFSPDPARRRTVPGAGLGLSISKSIIARFNGTISITNRPDGGLLQTVSLEVLRP